MIEPLSIHGSGYFSPEVSGQAPLDLALLERSLRRGLSGVTRLFMHAAKLALADAALAPGQIPVIFASAFGEIATAEALFAEAFDADGSSPARFRHSVHNTAPGLLSISAKSRLPCTAIAAGFETVAMALCEAAAQLANEAERVLLVFAEEPVPLALSAEHPHGPLAAGFVLGLGKGTQRARARISGLRRLPGRAEFRHPLAPALALAQAVAERRSQTLVVGDGELPLCVDVEVRQEP